MPSTPLGTRRKRSKSSQEMRCSHAIPRRRILVGDEVGGQDLAQVPEVDRAGRREPGGAHDGAALIGIFLAGRGDHLVRERRHPVLGGGFGLASTATPAHGRSLTGFVSVPMPSTVTETVCPATIGPTPAGVPVRMVSPGSRVMTRLM